ncbi:MAG: class I SAM-dependent methyltransferase [Isosphaeraceae bacterium]
MKPVILASVLMILAVGVVFAQRPGPVGPSNPLLQVFDSDRDGAISPAEIEAAAGKLRGLDADRDGKLTIDELPRGPRARINPAAAAEPASDPGKPTLPKDDGEKRILEAIAKAQAGERYANVSAADGRLLRQLAESINAQRVVELGTSTGESGLWFSLALRKTGGKLYTYDIDPGRSAVARANFKRGGVEDLIVMTLGDAHQTAVQNKEPIDLLFIDAEKEGYDAYLKELLPYVRPGGLIVAHNMRRPTPNPRYLQAITTDPNLDTSFVLMDGAGVGITLKKR